jgi:LacI family transcriptional regulator
VATSNKAAPAAADTSSGATVHDVARLAGVSAMTVSRVINGRASVSAATRGKVEAAIASLHYQPNLAARAARTGTLRIGLLYSNPSAAFLSEFLVGAMDQCRQGGGQLLLERCGDLASQRAAIDCLVAAGVDGIRAAAPVRFAAVLAQLNQMGIPPSPWPRRAPRRTSRPCASTTTRARWP